VVGNGKIVVRDPKAQIEKIEMKKFTIIKLAFAFFLSSLMAANSQTVLPGEKQEIYAAEGMVVAARGWDISAELNNKIGRLHFVEGQIVKKGDLLVEFDTAYKKGEVYLAEAIAERAKAQMGLMEEILSRQERLKDKNIVSLANYREALFKYRIAKADYRATEIKFLMAKGILEVQKLYAPFDGQLSAARYRENANVDISDGTEIATLVQLDPIHVRFSVPYNRVFERMKDGETDAEIAARQRVVLTLPNGSTYEHEGKLISGGFDINPQTGEQSVLVVFPNPKRILRPGLKVVGAGYEK
jgi:RND family efflux transporter MFP subunit